MARDQRNYREVDRERQRAGKRRPEFLALVADGLAHRATGASMPYTLCGKRVTERTDSSELRPCPDCHLTESA